MKKGLKKIITSGLIVASSVGLCACGTKSEEVEASYKIYGYDTAYMVNDEFSLSGAKLKITNKDGSETDVAITEDMVKEYPDMSTAGTKTITLVYGGKEFSITIEVYIPETDGYGYEFRGFQTTYDLNEQFNIANLKLLIDCEGTNDAEIPVLQSMIVSMPDMTTEGTKNVVVSYHGKTYSFSFEVKDSAKSDMMNKIQDFMNNYNYNNIKSSEIKINIEGSAKYLENSVKFKETLLNYSLSNISALDGYDIYKLNDAYVFTKEFDTQNELTSADRISMFGTKYIVLMQAKDSLSTSAYGTLSFDRFAGYVEMYGEPVPTTIDEFKDSLQFTNFWLGDKDDKEILIFNSKFAQPIYKAITDALVKETLNISKDDVVSSRDGLTAQLDFIKTLQNINTNLTNIDYYDLFVNKIILTESNSTYVELARTFIAEMLEITDQNTLDALDTALAKDIESIRNNGLKNSETTYNMIVELNNIIQKSNGIPSSLEQLNIIVSGIEKNDSHILSKFIYSCKNFVSVYQYSYGETEDSKEATSGNRYIYDSYFDEEKCIFKYKEKVGLVEADELVDAYYTGLKSFVEKFENIESYENIKTFANAVIADIRAMDKVVQEMAEKGYESDLMNFYVSTNVRIAVEYYVELYDAEVIADILDMLSKIDPESKLHAKLPENIITLLKECSDLIYQEFSKTKTNAEIDYVKLISDICDRLGVEKDKYIEKYNKGELTIFVDLFDCTVGDFSDFKDAERNFCSAIRETCVYLDSLLVKGTDRTKIMDGINKAAKAVNGYLVELGENYELEQFVSDVIVRLTDTKKDFNANFKDVLTEYKEVTIESVARCVRDTLLIDKTNETAYNNLKTIVDSHLTAYLEDKFVVGDLISDLNEYVDIYCEDDVKIYAKAVTIMSVVAMNKDADVDYNELLKDIELPNEIKDVDFNKLIKETLKDKETYDIFDLQDVIVDYVTDDDGKITKEILTISLNANYDIMLSSMDAKVTLTIEIDF